jgi:dethiobiotin synthetase
MALRFIFVTGNDTGVGKTVVAAFLTRYLIAKGCRAIGLKPICSGSRKDATALHEAAWIPVALDAINPWHFRTPIAPLLAARQEGVQVSLNQVVNHLRKASAGRDYIVIEGAGGLLSPLGENFDSRDLILALDAIPVVVVPNRLGAVNQARLVLEALSSMTRNKFKNAKRVHIILVDPSNTSGKRLVARGNIQLLAQYTPLERLHVMPRLNHAFPKTLNPRLRKLAAAILGFP